MGPMQRCHLDRGDVSDIMTVVYVHRVLASFLKNIYLFLFYMCELFAYVYVNATHACNNL